VLEPASPAVGLKTAGSSDVATEKKIRYFSNFYRQPEPGEVFVGGRLKAGDEVQSDQSTSHVSWMNDSGRPFRPVLPPNLPFPLNSTTQFPHVMAAYPSLGAVWGAHRPVHGTMTSFPPWLGHVTAYDVTESAYLCRRLHLHDSTDS